mmetsp:Transcript_37526/g.118358  ORF Transcript_37526/g.118358 Transcript_37526/m.118358 type:complete len:92 (+) Transcript_37526:1432-1707(+)
MTRLLFVSYLILSQVGQLQKTLRPWTNWNDDWQLCEEASETKSLDGAIAASNTIMDDVASEDVRERREKSEGVHMGYLISSFLNPGLLLLS